MSKTKIESILQLFFGLVIIGSVFVYFAGSRSFAAVHMPVYLGLTGVMFTNAWGSYRDTGKGMRALMVFFLLVGLFTLYSALV